MAAGKRPHPVAAGVGVGVLVGSASGVVWAWTMSVPMTTGLLAGVGFGVTLGLLVGVVLALTKRQEGRPVEEQAA
ncbi:hypothetical protein ACFQH6_09230 [Halobacteriaceae archaeon GCM10025711]